MAKKAATILGIVFLVAGLAGFVAPNLLGAHLSTAHNLIHLVSGAVALWVGLRSTPEGARRVDYVFGAAYGLLGIAGFALGAGEAKLVEVIPGALVLGTMDHVIHVLLGIAFVGAAALSPTPHGEHPRTPAVS